MNLMTINWWAVLVATFLNMVVGGLWFNPKTFFPIWWKGLGKTEKDTPGGESMNLVWAMTVLSAFVQSVAMALMVRAMGGLMSGGVSALSGMGTGFMLWLGFVAPTYLLNKMFAGHGLKIWAIETGEHLINFVIAGLIFGAWH